MSAFRAKPSGARYRLLRDVCGGVVTTAAVSMVVGALALAVVGVNLFPDAVPPEVASWLCTHQLLIQTAAVCATLPTLIVGWLAVHFDNAARQANSCTTGMLPSRRSKGRTANATAPMLNCATATRLSGGVSPLVV